MKKNECRLQILASTKHGRILECPGHRGFILEFDPMVLRLRAPEFHEIATLIDRIALRDNTVYSTYDNFECRENSFVIQISTPRISVEFYQEEIPGINQLFADAQLSMILHNNRILRPHYP